VAHVDPMLEPAVLLDIARGRHQVSPEIAGRSRRCFDTGTNKTLGTPRRPTTGSEIELSSGGEHSLGVMPRSMRLLDVRRDPRVALQSDPGSAK
jgi:hypothetical protein